MRTYFGPGWRTITAVSEDLVPLLAKFHRDVLLPDVRRVVAEAVEASERRLRDEMHTGFDSLARELTDLRELSHGRGRPEAARGAV